MSTATDAASMGMLELLPMILIIVGGIIGLAIYFIPAFIAFKRNCVQKVPILLLNIFLGWSYIGWVIALIWANMKDKNQQ